MKFIKVLTTKKQSCHKALYLAILCSSITLSNSAIAFSYNDCLDAPNAKEALCKEAFLDNNSISWYKLGYVMKFSDENAALQCFERSATAGFDKAQYEVGMAYKTGKFGVTPDPQKALYWFKQAEKNGHSLATAEVNKLDQQQRRPTDLSVGTTNSANGSSPTTNNTSGNSIGSLTKEDIALQNKKLEEQASIFKKCLNHPHGTSYNTCVQAVKQHQPDALYKVGTAMLQNDPKTAETFLIDAAKQNNAKAQYELGNYYSKKRDKNSLDKAAYWFRQAAANNYTPANSALERLNTIESTPAQPNNTASADRKSVV